ncbi:biogenesis of lysosome-related organelles complex-1 subunit 2-domain-containing protein [Pilobolus umbonatus]|nr:biogenesis of lysosome-related organelles complex-1 subunit 2-domain-containing protein [Pilobolus umbonatus]
MDNSNSKNSNNDNNSNNDRNSLIVPSVSISSSSATPSKKSYSKGLRPTEYSKGLVQEHIVKLTQDVYKNFTEYTKEELKATIEDCKLLETMNISTKDKYSQLNQMSQHLMKEISKLQTIYADFSGFIQQIEEINEQTIQMENTAKALDEYSRYLESKLMKII